jgi:hypothetical protein
MLVRRFRRDGLLHRLCDRSGRQQHRGRFRQSCERSVTSGRRTGRHEIAPVVSAHLKLKNVHTLQATGIHRNAVPVAGPENWCAAGRAEMMASVCITPEISGKPAFLREEAHSFHRHFPVHESGAYARRAVTLVKARQFGIYLQPDRAAVAGELVWPRHPSAPPSLQTSVDKHAFSLPHEGVMRQRPTGPARRRRRWATTPPA